MFYLLRLTYVYIYICYIGSEANSFSSENSLVEEILPAAEALQEAGPSQVSSAKETPPLDEHILKALRAEVAPQKKEIDLHRALGENWDRILRNGLKKEDRTQLLEKYPRTGNCRMEAPALNEEVDSFISEKMRKRDRLFIIDQNVCGTGLSALGLAISMILDEQEEGIDKLKLLELLNDAGWLLSELFHLLTVARRSFMFSSMDAKMGAILEKAKADEWLFGTELSQKIKSARAAEKVGSTLRFQPLQRKDINLQSSGKWKSPVAKTGYQGRPQAGSAIKWSQRQPSGFRMQSARSVRTQPLSHQQYQPRGQYRD